MVRRVGSLVFRVALVGGAAGLAPVLASTAGREVARLASRRVLGPPAGPAFDDLVLVGALVVLAAISCWLGLAVVLTVATEALRCSHTAVGRLARSVTPSLCRGLLSGACGAAVLAGPATAAGPPVLPVPDRPARYVPTATATTKASVPVRRGDTLWAIAARHLPAGAADAEIATAWPAWFRLNRGPIGPDPHLIRPGTRLLVPPRHR
jgi:nucleoid-associated protein YgaU